jgi:beta-galactosidase
VRIVNPGGLVVGTETASGKNVSIDVQVPKPTLWTYESDSPNIYTVEVQCGNFVERERFGYRFFGLDKDGMTFNGKRMKINGVCLHEDNGCVGMESNVSMIEWKLRKMKKMGCNSIRTAHNPFSRQFIDACDRLGLIVIEEMYDCWWLTREGNTYDFARFFTEHYAEATRNTVRRDVNSPSILMWTVGNEIKLDSYTYDQVNAFLPEFISVIREIDKTRAITMGNDQINKT